MAPTVYLISGANRGLGFGLVQHLVARDEVIVFAGARDPASATALGELASKHQGKLHVIKLVSADVANNHAAVDQIKKIAGRLDVVVANVGIGESKPVLEASIESMQHHFTVNTLGTMVLAQTTYPLLKASTDTPKFVAISSRIGSIAAGTGFPVPHVQYGASKAALNWMIKKLWTENPGLITFPICPGLVDTDGSREAMAPFPEFQELLTQMGHKAAPVEDGTRLILEQIDKATRETSDFISEKGETLPW